MTERLRVTVTQEDIDAGCHSPHNCPMARALTRAGLSNASVLSEEAGAFSADGTYIEIALSGPAKRFIARYDDGNEYAEPVHPATFILTRKETPT